MRDLLSQESARPEINLLREAGAEAQPLGADLNDVVALEVAAEAALESGDARRAVALYTRLIERAPVPLANHLVARGKAHYAIGEYEAAIGDYERGLAIEPKYPDLQFDKGTAELQAGRAGDADASFTADLHDGPTPISFYNRHLARKALGDREGALEDLDRAIAGMPDEAPLRVARSILRAANGDHEGAFADADVAVRLEPTDIALHERCGRLALGIGRYARAIEAYATARHLATEAGDPWSSTSPARRSRSVSSAASPMRSRCSIAPSRSRPTIRRCIATAAGCFTSRVAAARRSRISIARSCSTPGMPRRWATGRPSTPSSVIAAARSRTTAGSTSSQGRRAMMMDSRKKMARLRAQPMVTTCQQRSRDRSRRDGIDPLKETAW